MQRFIEFRLAFFQQNCFIGNFYTLLSKNMYYIICCFIILFVHVLCLCWVFVAVWALLSLRSVGAALPCGSWASHCSARPLCSTRASVAEARGSVAVAPRLWSTGRTVLVLGLSCPTACGIFLDEGSNLCCLH